MPHSDSRALFERLAAQRILVLDGAMGTLIQTKKLVESDYRGQRFANHARDLRGNNDLLALTSPDLIRELHEAYLEAGADIIETNTFNSTTVSQSDYDLGSVVYELNIAACRLARLAVDKWSERTPDRPRVPCSARRRARTRRRPACRV